MHFSKKLLKVFAYQFITRTDEPLWFDYISDLIRLDWVTHTAGPSLHPVTSSMKKRVQQMEEQSVQLLLRR